MFSDLKLSSNTCKILQEIVVEFVKNVEEEEEENKIYEFEDIYDTVLTDCAEYRTVKEYSHFASGDVSEANNYVYSSVSKVIANKIVNSFNVVGSDWSFKTCD